MTMKSIFLTIPILLTAFVVNAQNLPQHLEESVVLYVDNKIPVAILGLGEFDGVKVGDRVVVKRNGYMLVELVRNNISYAVPEFLEQIPERGDRVKLHHGFTYREILQCLQTRLPPPNKKNWVKIHYGCLIAYQDKIGHEKICVTLNDLRKKLGKPNCNYFNSSPGADSPYLNIYRIENILDMLDYNWPGEYELSIGRDVSYKLEKEDVELLMQIKDKYAAKFMYTVNFSLIFINSKTLYKCELEKGKPIRIIKKRKNLAKIKTLLGAEGWIPLNAIRRIQ